MLANGLVIYATELKVGNCDKHDFTFRYCLSNIWLQISQFRINWIVICILSKHPNPNPKPQIFKNFNERKQIFPEGQKTEIDWTIHYFLSFPILYQTLLYSFAKITYMFCFNGLSIFNKRWWKIINYSFNYKKFQKYGNIRPTSKQ